MGAQDDFGLWESELREPVERSGGRGMLVAAAMTTLGCTGLIVLGEKPLGAAGLILSALILLLWRAGL